MNLEASSIRPGRPLEWHRQLKERIIGEVVAASATGADVHIHVGNWLHDLRQASPLLCLALHVVSVSKLRFTLNAQPGYALAIQDVALCVHAGR